jgi:hypothetical protein
MFEELKQMNAELEELKKIHLEKSKSMFTKISKMLFDKHPKLESFGWRQYTPYFNDGDECTFSAHTDEPDINDINGYDFSRQRITDYNSTKVEGKYQEIDNPQYNPDLDLARQDVVSLLNGVDDSVLRQMFGDHVHIKVTSESTEVEEYDHD